MTEYIPELGQALFGQPTQAFEADNLMDAAINLLADELSRVLGNITQQRPIDNPFSNSGSRFDTEGLSIHAYSWSDDDQPWNLKCGDVEVSWYKYAGRGMSVNKPMSPNDIKAFLDCALGIILACEGGGEFSKGQKFTYDGTVYNEQA